MASHWKHADDLELEEIDDGFIAYDAARDRVHHLNPTAALVFLLANGENTAVDIARIVQAQYNLDAAPLDDVKTVLDQFSQEGIASPV